LRLHRAAAFQKGLAPALGEEAGVGRREGSEVGGGGGHMQNGSFMTIDLIG